MCTASENNSHSCFTFKDTFLKGILKDAYLESNYSNKKNLSL